MPGELTEEECLKVVDSLAAGEQKPMVIWTGGEPMLRGDLVRLVAHATEKGLRGVLAPCGAYASVELLRELKAAGIMACSFSLDGPDAASHDSFRGVTGAYEMVTGAMAAAREAGLPFQVNATVSKLNRDKLDAIYARAQALGATRLDLFFLVPVGRGSAIADLALDDDETRRVIAWARDRKTKLTCCPQAGTCIGGRGFAFLSHVGDLQTCGFVDVPCGNVRDFDYDFRALVAAAKNPLGSCGNCRTHNKG